MWVPLRWSRSSRCGRYMAGAATGTWTRNRTGQAPPRRSRASASIRARSSVRRSQGRFATKLANRSPGARVCADASSPNLSSELVRDPRCAATNASGAYLIANLYAAEYNVAAMAPQYLPESFTADSFELRAGEHRTGVDIVIVRGGVEVRGVVSDVSGGGIARASVRVASGMLQQSRLSPTVETDDTGAFSLWVKAGDVMVSAVADGYAEGIDFGRAPGKVNLLLTPESSVAGTVADAKSNEPVAGVTVEANGGSDITDDQGHFHVTRITPGRYTLVARSPHGYGHSDGSSRFGLGQHVTGVVVKLYPAFQISGRVVEPGASRATCKESSSVMKKSLARRRMVVSSPRRLMCSSQSCLALA